MRPMRRARQRDLPGRVHLELPPHEHGRAGRGRGHGPDLPDGLGPNSIEKFWLEKSLEFWLEIPYTKKKLKNV